MFWPKESEFIGLDINGRLMIGRASLTRLGHGPKQTLLLTPQHILLRKRSFLTSKVSEYTKRVQIGLLLQLSILILRFSRGLTLLEASSAS